MAVVDLSKNTLCYGDNLEVLRQCRTLPVTVAGQTMIDFDEAMAK